MVLETPNEIAKLLKDAEDMKDQNTVVKILNRNVQNIEENVEFWIDSNICDEKTLSYIATTAFNFENVEIYKILTREEIMPFNLTYDSSEEEWVDYIDKLMTINNNELLILSLRFFRTGEGMENLWRNHIEYLINISNDYHDTRGLGSIIRIVWNTSLPDKRSDNLKELLLSIWNGFIEDNECNDESNHYRVVDFFYNALSSTTRRAFYDSNVWTEHAMRNLVIETLENGLVGQINHKNPSKSFCREIGIDFHQIEQYLN